MAKGTLFKFSYGSGSGSGSISGIRLSGSVSKLTGSGL